MPSFTRTARRSGAAVLTLLLVLLTAGSASAAPRPKLTLSLPPAGGDEHAPIAYSWTADHVTAASSLVLQRTFGTAHAWRTVARLKGASGSGKLAGLPLGSYHLRIANLGPKIRHRSKLLAEQQRTFHVFGRVSLAQLLGGAGTADVYTMPTGTFPYVVTAIYTGTAFTAAHNACRSIHLDFAAEPQTEYAPPSTATLTVVQEAADPLSASAMTATVGSLDAQLTPGRSWSTTVAKGSAVGGIEMHLNGYASCYSTDQALRLA